jgi:hypothetical protein
MTGIFADTFYWVAFTNIQDLAHEKAKAFTLASTPRLIVVTEEVLTEYLNYFAAWGPRFRGMAAASVQEMRAAGCELWRKQRPLLGQAWPFINRASTRATA